MKFNKRLLTKFAVDLILNFLHRCSLSVHSRRQLRLISTGLSCGCMLIDKTAQEAYVAEVFSASTITIETIKYLRYFASYLVGSPDIPGKHFRW